MNTQVIDKMTAAVVRAEQHAAIEGAKPAHPHCLGHWQKCDRPWCQDLLRDHRASKAYTKEMDAARLRDMESMCGV